MGRIINNYGNLSQWMSFDGYFNIGILRGMSDMTVGAICALILLPAFRKQKKVMIMGIIIPIIFIAGLVFVRDFISYNDLIFYIPLFGILITAITALEYPIPEILNRLGCYLGKLSYPIFLTHYGCLVLVKEWSSSIDYMNMWFIFLLAEMGIVIILLAVNKALKGGVECRI